MIEGIKLAHGVGRRVAGVMKGVELGPSFFIPFGEVRLTIGERGFWLGGKGVFIGARGGAQGGRGDEGSRAGGQLLHSVWRGEGSDCGEAGRERVVNLARVER